MRVLVEGALHLLVAALVGVVLTPVPVEDGLDPEGHGERYPHGSMNSVMAAASASQNS